MNNSRQNITLDEAIEDSTARYVAANPQSLKRHEAAKASLPGGNTRSTIWYEPFPVTITQGQGCHVHDIDGHDYVDFVCEYTASLYGHSNPDIMEAMREAIHGGVALGGPNHVEAALADELISRFTALEKVRFTNSGTEANIMAISTAREVTKRRKVVVINGGYHGGVLTFGHGGSVLNLPFPWLFADYNNIEETEELLRAEGDDIACVIIEQMLGAGGCIPATGEFLTMLREVTQEIGALLIFDEVMTSRLHYGGMHAITGITPDLMTLGKYIGGGTSFGAFGGRTDIMDRFDPASSGAFGHGGTFNNNIISMSAGLAGLTKVLTKQASQNFNSLGDQLRMSIQKRINFHGVEATVSGYGSLFNLHFLPKNTITPSAIDTVDPRPGKLWHLEMMLAGQYVTPRGMMALSLPHDQDHADGLLNIFDRFLEDYRTVLPKA